ncbi:MAG: sugar ABC transporter ATP-binding protein [Spirochaetia bacterium]|jgi:ribose transport system ATP-binding protein
MTGLQPLLEARGISKSYGGVRALINADFSCARGEVHALLGENGAGKSTLVKILSGAVRADAGEVILDGTRVQIESPGDAERLGIGAVFQELSLVPHLSVSENIYLGHEPLGRGRLIDFARMRKDAAALLSSIGFPLDPEAVVAELSLSDRQVVEIAKVMARDPGIIVFDEATSALGSAQVEGLFALIRSLSARGKTSIFISHRMEEIEKIADRATIFRDARTVTTFTFDGVTKSQIVTWIAGRSIDEVFPARQPLTRDAVILETRNLSSGRMLGNVSVSVREGEILGIAGLQGHGQSEFLRALYGAIPARGSILLSGRQVTLDSPSTAIRHGIAYIPEDRKAEGLMLTRSIRENLSLMVLRSLRVWGFLSRRRENQNVSRISGKLAIRAASVEQNVNSLSGGNQQKIVIGKAMLTGARILLLADPTRGIDVTTKTEIYRLIRELSALGTKVLFHSTELPELIGLCHRVVVFKQGTIVRELEGDAIDEHAVINAALGMG